MFYAGTGEGYGYGDAARGIGIFKSTDAGLTWSALASTSAFIRCQRIVVTAAGAVIVANNTGLHRSTNIGTTWTKVLGTGLGITGAVNNFAYDVDIAINGDIYATLAGSVHKSTDGGATFGAAFTLPMLLTRLK